MRASWRRSTPTGGRRTTCRSARSTCSTTRSCASRCGAEHIKPRLLGHWGTTPGPELRLRPPQPRDPRSATSTRSTSPAPATAARRSSPTPTSRARYTRGLSATSRRDAAGMRAPVPPVLLPGRHPEPRRARDARLDPRGRRARLRARPRLRRGLRQPGPASSPASSATARRRPDRWPRAGTRTSSSTPRATAPCCRSCTSTATRSPTRRSSPASPTRSCVALLRGLRLRAAASSRATTPTTVHQAMAAALDDVARRRSRRSSARARAGGTADAPALADDRAAHAEGLDRARGGRRPAGRGHVALAPGPAGRRPRRTRRTSRSSRRGCAATGPRSCSTTTARLRAGARRRSRPTGDRRMSANPHANGGVLLRDLACPTSATTRSTCRRPAPTTAEATRVLGTFLRDVMRPQPPTHVPRSSGRTRPRRTGSTPSSR